MELTHAALIDAVARRIVHHVADTLGVLLRRSLRRHPVDTFVIGLPADGLRQVATAFDIGDVAGTGAVQSESSP